MSPFFMGAYHAPRRAWACCIAPALAIAVTAACSSAPAPTAAQSTPSTPAFMASTATATPAFPSGVLAAPTVPSGRNDTLCGSTLAACPPGLVGKPSTQQPTAATVGDFTELDLHTLFDTPQGAEASVAEGGPAPQFSPQGWGAPGINGTPYPAQDFPSTGSFTVPIHGLKASFLIPAEGVGIRSTFDLAAPVDIPVPPAPYHAVWILGNGIGGGAGDVLLIAHYQGGTSTGYTFDFTDWCSPQTLAPGEFIAALAPYLLKAQSGKMTPSNQGCGGLYAAAIPIDASKSLTGLSIPGAIPTLLGGGTGGAQNDFITAISLQK